MHDNHDVVFEFAEPGGAISTNIIGSRLVPDPRASSASTRSPASMGCLRTEGSCISNICMSGQSVHDVHSDHQARSQNRSSRAWTNRVGYLSS